MNEVRGMRVAVIGAGNGGLASAVELTLAGHEVALHGRSPATVAPYAEHGIGYEGMLGEGRLRPALVTSDLAEAIRDADAAVIALPTFALSEVAAAHSAAGWGSTRPVVLNPGHTGGAFELETGWGRAPHDAVPPGAAIATPAHVARQT